MKNLFLKQLLYCNQSMGQGGAEAFMVDLLVALKKRQWQVAVATTNRDLFKLCRESEIAAHQQRWVMDVIGDWKGLVKAVVFGPLALWQWWHVLRQERDREPVVLLSGFNEKLLVTPIAKVMGFQVVWIEFSSLKPVLNMWFGLVGKWYRLLLPSVVKIITSSEHSKQKLKDELALVDGKILVIPCGREAGQVIKSAPNHKNNITCISRLQPGKGQDLLIKAMPIILKKFPKARLILVGEGDFAPSLQSIVAELSLEPSVSFTGRVAQIEPFLTQTGVVVFPSMWELEGFGLVLIEAMAAGLPIVTFDHGPMNEIIHHRRNGLLAKSGSVESLAEMIIELLGDQPLSKKLSSQARLDFTNSYTIDKIAQRYDQDLTLYYR